MYTVSQSIVLNCSSLFVRKITVSHPVYERRVMSCWAIKVAKLIRSAAFYWVDWRGYSLLKTRLSVAKTNESALEIGVPKWLLNLVVYCVHSYLPPLVSCRELIRWSILPCYFILSAHLMTGQLTYGTERNKVLIIFRHISFVLCARYMALPSRNWSPDL